MRRAVVAGGVVAIAAAVGVLGACNRGSSESPPPATTKEVVGALALDGKPLVVTRCRPGRGVTTFVELVTAAGTLRFEDRQLFWRTDPQAVSRGAPLDCEKLDRSWGGGQRLDGTAYFRGRLDFRCRGAVGALVGDVTVDCGEITAAERASLDANRQQTLDQQAGSGSGSATPGR